VLLKIQTTKASRTGGRIKKGDPVMIGLYRCDHCNKEFEKRCSQMIGKCNHFCSRSCRNAERTRSGLIGKTREATCIELYGVRNTFQSDVFQAKTSETMLQRYGVVHAMDIPAAREKVTQANIQRWALTTTEDIANIQHKKRMTCIERYGVEHPMMSIDVRQRATQSMLDRGFLRSKAERFLESMLVTLFGRHDVMTQIWQNNVAGRNHPVDIYVRSLRLMIEYDGYHHHRPEVKQRDEEFNIWCVNHNRRLLRITESELSTVLGRIQTRLPNRLKRLAELATPEALSTLHSLVTIASTMQVNIITAHTVLQTITTPPTTASCVKLEP
jgi:very-short-patch-repair endonuclease